MEFLNHLKILQSVIVFIIGLTIQVLATRSLKKIQLKFGFHASRILVSSKIISILVYLTIIIVIAFIWNVDEKQLLIYISSFLTILGIAFFAQWSLLSNITAGLILYINYPVKIGDTITILEKDNNITGEIKDIGAFFITLKTEEEALITLPNAIILQKNIRYNHNKNISKQNSK
ncbi:mechanosensitive ion channel domain-containing protein [uncultured Polaribacter sp.]|uniref:mechanosensitive ion channel domain-containing protein n=1 Tax=uncultured Polaribacter sp. TaxID=174711 RepID=UPI002611DF0F|nr:mechanosensitive ion channel domain-containing protein [uncultured Polaribacter sp.]